MAALVATSGVFDASHYAASGVRKLKRSLQLGPRYFLWDLPRYLARRRRLHLPGWDLAAFFNPLWEFRPKRPSPFPLPSGYDDALSRLFKAGVRLTMPRDRLEALVGAWWTTRAVPGDVIECGSYQGATALLLAVLAEMHRLPRITLLLDTFSGSPTPCCFDLSRSAGEFTPPLNQVDLLHEQASALGILGRIEIHQGLFAETFPRLEKRDLRFAFVHIDANLYRGTREACLFTLPRLLPGGAAVFDDYNGVCDLGARLAIDEVLASRRCKPVPLAGSSALLRA